MTYLLIDDHSTEGKKMIAELKKSKLVRVLNKPNEETQRALIEAKKGKGKIVNDTKKWIQKLTT
jgi:hypothetical protein